jgi:hypothetical protein
MATTEEKLDEGMEAMAWQVDVPGVIEELADRLYTRPEAACREAASNAIDSGTNRIEFVIDHDRLSMEDWGGGVERPELLANIAKGSKHGKIGEKGIGRLALMRLGEKVEFLSNNSEIGIRVVYERKQTPMKDIRRFDKFLPHQGTKVIVHNTTDEVPKQKFLLEYLGKVYAPLILEGLVITVNNIRAELPENFIEKERHILTLDGGQKVTGGIIPDKKSDGKLDVYIHGALVKENMFISMNQFRGWVRCDSLTPRTDRDDIVQDKQFNIFRDHMVTHIRRNFAKIDELDTNLGTQQMNNKIKDLFQKYLKDAKRILPPLPGDVIPGTTSTGLEGGTGGQEGPDVPGFTPSNEHTGKTFGGSGVGTIGSNTKGGGTKPIIKGKGPSDKAKKPNEPLIIENTGDSDWPISAILEAVPQPVIIIFKKHPITKVCYKEKTSLGSKLFRLIPFLARAFYDGTRRNANETTDQYMREVYRITTWLYEKEGLI